MALVAVTHRLLRDASPNKALLRKLQCQLGFEPEGSVTFQCRMAQAQSPENLARLIAAALTPGPLPSQGDGNASGDVSVIDVV
jgi:hypothetical protein